MSDDGPFPVFGANGIIGRYHEYNHSEAEILLGCRGSCGTVNVSFPKSWVTGNAMVIRPRDNSLSKEFLRYFLDGSTQISGVITGVAQPQITQKSLSIIEIPIPPLDEQRRIVAVLDRVFAGIATATTNAQRNLANARELFDSYVRSTFSERGTGWITQPFDQVCENLDYLRRPVTKSDRETGRIPYYGASGQVDSVADHLFDEDLLLVSEDGANLLMRTYPIAFSISGKSWVNNHAHVLRFADRDTQSIVEYYLNSISLEPYVSGMAQPKLNQKALNGIPIPLPPTNERAGIVERLDELSRNIEALEVNHRSKLSALTELKQSLLQKAFAGELT